MRKFLFIVFLALTSMPLLGAKPAPEFYFEGYEPIPLSFLREHYTEIENGRHIKFDGWYQSNEWLPLYQYQQKLKDVGLNLQEFNLVKFSFREAAADDIHFSFPILLFRAVKGDVSEFKTLPEGTHVVVYGTFYNLRNSDWALIVDTVETIERGGFDRQVISDYRMAPTATPTATVTATPGPNLMQRLWNKVNPKETPAPSGTVTPDASPAPTAAVSPTPSSSPAMVHHPKKSASHRHPRHKNHKAKGKAHPKNQPAATPTPVA